MCGKVITCPLKSANVCQLPHYTQHRAKTQRGGVTFAKVLRMFTKSYRAKIIAMRCHSVSGNGEPNAIRIPIGTDSSATARPRLRGLPLARCPLLQHGPFHNRLSDTIECSQPLPKILEPKILHFVNPKHYPTPEWYAGCSRSHDAVIRVYDAAGNVIETHEHKGDFKEIVSSARVCIRPE